MLECFHGYLSKYLIMIVRGTIPQTNSFAGKDCQAFLRMLVPKSTKITPEVISNACKSLHLAFKSMTTEDIYDTLAFCSCARRGGTTLITRTRFARSVRL